MSALIKGMKMPENCIRCAFRTFGRCALSVEITDAICNDSRPNDCPLSEVPPHGRLIDADAVIDRIDMNIDLYGADFPLSQARMRSFIEHAPTVIKAEEGEA